MALVTGAGGGLGGQIAVSLAAEGVHIAAVDLRRDAADATARAVRKSGGRAIALEWDLSEPSVIDDNLDRIEDELGAIDILVNNTGGPPPTKALGVGLAQWRQHFNAMVAPVVGISDRVVPGMAERGWGRVITSASSGVVAPIADLGLSNSLRSTLVGWSKTLSAEVAAQGVTCNVVVPGRIGTARIRALDEARASQQGRDLAEVVADSVAAIPVGRYGDPVEYAAAVTFLASAPASYITGSLIRVDGGLIPSI
ncbi:SDR family oxidoreductase [Nocardia sp. NPDC050697]|uniref:SDR family oxidoreductase n=1 Tax=Nocardia sp. NPDC050697 TaxID=3155158 RepID=UPI0033F9C8A0